MPFFKTILNALINHDKNMEEIHLHLKMLQTELAEIKKENNGPPIVIEHINIENLHVDKYELSNNFANLGIKDLKGKLNIGANYGQGMTVQDEDEQQEKVNEAMKKMKEKKEQVHQKKQDGPNYSIKGRKP